MRKLTAVTIALGFLAATSMPTFATIVVNPGVAKTDNLSAATKKKKKPAATQATQKTADTNKKRKTSKKKPMKKDEKKS